MARATTDKKSRYEEALRDEGNILLRREFKDPRLSFVSFTKVELNDDYSTSKFYWDTYDAGHRGDIKSALNGVVGKFRVLLAHKVELRHTPQIEFIYDAQFEEQKKIEALLAKKNPEEE